MERNRVVYCLIHFSEFISPHTFFREHRRLSAQLRYSLRWSSSKKGSAQPQAASESKKIFWLVRPKKGRSSATNPKREKDNRLSQKPVSPQEVSCVSAPPDLIACYESGLWPPRASEEPKSPVPSFKEADFSAWRSFSEESNSSAAVGACPVVSASITFRKSKTVIKENPSATRKPVGERRWENKLFRFEMVQIIFNYSELKNP